LLKLDRGDYETLSSTTNDQRWQATGHFRRGEYEEAAERFAETTDDDAIYNQATALARDGEFDQSLQLYDDLLSRTPDHVDARHNRDIVQRLKELNQQTQQQQSAGEEQEGSSQPESAEKEEIDLEQLNDEAQQQAQESLERKQEQALQELAEAPLTEQQLTGLTIPMWVTHVNRGKPAPYPYEYEYSERVVKKQILRTGFIPVCLVAFRAKHNGCNT